MKAKNVQWTFFRTRLAESIPMKYWLNSSEEDYNVMKYLYNGKKNSYCLFFGHYLLALAEKCNLELTDKQVEKLQIITQFNISARYDDYKETFN